MKETPNSTDKLKIRNIYLAGPIDQAAGDNKALNIVKDQLVAAGCVCYNPYTSFECNKGVRAERAINVAKTEGDTVRTWLVEDSAEFIITTNRAAIKSCSVVVVVIPDNNPPTVGTWREVEYARRYKKPIIVLAPIDYHKSIELYDCILGTLSSDVLHLLGKVSRGR